jgi:DNA-binding FadR family transcriptional regulator
MKLKAVSNRKLYIQIADQIRDQIKAGAVEPGHQLPSERDLALSLSVSRPTVREALIALEVAGLIDVRVGVGAFVKAPNGKAEALPKSDHSPLEVVAVRRLLEPEAAALAAANTSPELKARLSDIAAEMRRETARGIWSAENDEALHLALAEAAGNLVLRDMLDGLWASRAGAVDTRFHQHLADIKQVREHILADHEAVIAAVIAGKADVARQAMAQHLDFVSGAMLDAWE